MEDPAAKLMRGLTEALVLESLRREPKHGYGLLKELEEVFGEAPNRNRIYPLLSRLEEEGYVEGRRDPDSSRGKTTYELTDEGRDRLEEYEAMPPSFQAALGRFWGAPPGPPGGGDPRTGDEAEGGAAGEPVEEDGDEPPTDGPGDREDDAEDVEDEEDDGEDAEDPDDEGGPPPGDGGPDGGGGGGGEGPGGMDLRRNPETGEVEMVIRGTHWGEVRIELGEIRDD